MFNSPGQSPCTPKGFEYSHRDAEHAVSPDHDHFHFTDTAAVPQKSRDYLNCCHYKRQLVGYLGEAFFENAWLITGTQDIPGTLADTGDRSR